MTLEFFISAKENHVIMHFLTSDPNNWSGPVNIWSGPAASGSNRPDCLAAKKINVEPCNYGIFFFVNKNTSAKFARRKPLLVITFS